MLDKRVSALTRSLKMLRARFFPPPQNRSLVVFIMVSVVITLVVYISMAKSAPKRQFNPPVLCSNFNGPKTPAPKKYPLCMITRVHNSAEWLPEWIEYHSEMGMSKFFIADDCSNDGGATRSILEYYHSLGIVEPYFEYGKRHPCGKKWYPDEDYLISFAFQRAKRAGCDWIAMIDVDEFITYWTPEWQSTPSLLPYLSQTLLPYVKLVWLEMSTEGHIEKPKGLAIEASHNIRSDPRHTKSIIRAEALSNWRFSHFSWDWEPHMKCLFDSGTFLSLQEEGTRIVTLPDGSEMKLPLCTIALKHFRMRSYEEFMRGRGSYKVRADNLPSTDSNNTEAWKQANFNTFDPSAQFTQMMAQLVRKRLKSRELPDIPHLPALD